MTTFYAEIDWAAPAPTAHTVQSIELTARDLVEALNMLTAMGVGYRKLAGQTIHITAIGETRVRGHQYTQLGDIGK